MANLTLDLLDRKILHALQINGRAPFSAMATVLEVSDQTVARRYRRMYGAGVLRVLAVPYRTDHVEWLVRLQCAPGAALATAMALARRSDSSWVSLTSGGTEVLCFIRRRAGQGDAQLFGDLPRAPQVISVSAHCLLRIFSGGPDGWSGRADTLTQDQIDYLRRPNAGASDDTPPSLRASENALLAELAYDGRASCSYLAKITGWSESVTQRRLEHLRCTEAIYFDVDIEPKLLGYFCEAIVLLSVPPSHLGEVGTALAGDPEIAFAAAKTGSTNLVAWVICVDGEAFYDYVEGRLGGIGTIHHVETAFLTHIIKRAGALRPSESLWSSL